MLGLPNPPALTPFQFEVDEIIHFDKDEEILPNPRNLQRLYLPTDQNHPAWDCIYDNGDITALFSLSISNFWDGHYDKARKSFEGGLLVT